MKLFTTYLSGSSTRWLKGAIFLWILILFSSCSSSKEASYAYLDDIYKPPAFKNYQTVYYNNEPGDVADQDGSIIKPYQTVVASSRPYLDSSSFNVAFGYSYISDYSYYNRWPFNWGYDNYCYRNGWSRNYCRYNRYYNPYGFYDPYYYSNNYFGYYNPNYYNTGRPGGSSGDSYIFGNNISYFKGINSTDKRSGYAINYAKYSNYRSSGSTDSKNGRKSGSTGKSRMQSSYNPNKSNSNKSSNFNSNSHYRSGSSGGSTGGSSSPSRSSGSGSGGSYTGKRPR